MSLATASDFFFACIEGVKDKIIKYHLDNCLLLWKCAIRDVYTSLVQYAFEKVFLLR